MAERRYKLIGQGLPGSANFSTADLSDNDVISWDAALRKWVAGASAGGGVTDHGALTGLADDDHTQYVLADGTRAIVTGSSSVFQDVDFLKITNEIRFEGAAGNNGLIQKNATSLRDELQIYSGGDAFSDNSAGAGIHLYGNSDSQHPGQFAVLTGADDDGDAHIHMDQTGEIAFGNLLWDYIDDDLYIGQVNIKDTDKGSWLHFERSSGSYPEVTISLKTGNNLLFAHDGTDRWYMDTAGNIRPNSDLGVDLGVSAARWGNLYCGLGDFEDTVNFKASAYSTDYAADFNNSDIRDVNSIYFSDTANNANEGLIFARTSGDDMADWDQTKFDTFRLYSDDILYWNGGDELVYSVNTSVDHKRTIAAGYWTGGASPTFTNFFGCTVARGSAGIYTITVSAAYAWANTAAGRARIQCNSAGWQYLGNAHTANMLKGSTNTVTLHIMNAAGTLVDPTDFNFEVIEYRA